MAGGRIYTDAIDNSAGVDTSDHEVNIKILLGLPIADGELTEKQRNALLAEMTDDVAALVLRDNYFQTQVLSVTGRIAPQLLDAQARFMQFLEKGGRLNRAIEFLPSDEEIAERRAGRARARPRPSARCCSPTARSGSTTSSWPRRCPTIRGSRRRSLRYFPAALRQALRGLHGRAIR